MTVCKNCEFSFEGRFCPNCSQKADTHRFSLYHVGHDGFHAITHTDKGILFLIKELFTRPGKVAIEYNAGKRKKYFNPGTFLMIMMALNVFAVKETDFYGRFTNAMQGYVHSISQKSKEVKTDMQRFDKDMEDARKQAAFANENSKLITFLYLPVVALLTRGFFRRSGHNYAENLVLNVFIMGQLIIFFLIICIIPFMINPALVVIVFYVYLIFSFVYTFIAYRQFFRQKWGWVLLKGIVVQALYLTLANYSSKFLYSYFY